MNPLAASATPQVYLVDDNADFRASAEFWLDAAGYAVRSLGDPHQALEALSAHPAGRLGCVLMDVRMPDISGLDLHDRMQAEGLRLPVIYMSGHADVALAVRAMRKGAVSFLEKPLDESALLEALQAALSPTAQAAASAVPTESAELPPDLQAAREEFLRRESSLAPREREVLALVIQGIYNKNIADRMNLSVKTIELYRARGMTKMGAKSVADLTRMMVSRQA
ncbi:response regulator [Pelomonas sp. CA6]|uniref:response regulator transcription factor n=1 Tax=Pelomonas sp. CA6 TaxID=2907999 RepID=UPI001F4C0054|nr:response regulator [Pelomonas sp. CA6]MCH7345070.1 response regulator [Pelomonas sp. CA6]